MITPRRAMERPPLVLSTDAACAYLGVGEWTLRRLRQEKRLVPIKLGNRLHWPTTALERFVAEEEAKAKRSCS